MSDDVGMRRLDAARVEFKRARYRRVVDTGDAEPTARSALGLARSAMDWLEDTDGFDEAHDLLHEIGQFTREEFGCSVTIDEDGYWRDCPADLAHIRCGMSPGLVIGASECSICHQDPAGCSHITGRIYDGERCHRIIIEIRDVLEVSLVARPAQPDARIQRVSVSTKDLHEALGGTWQPGMTVSCDKCHQPCWGFTRPAG